MKPASRDDPGPAVRLADVLHRVAYRDARFAIRPAPKSPGMVDLCIERAIPNSRADGGITLTVVETVPEEYETEDAAFEAVRRVIRTAELHEMDEWLLIDGQRRWDPHDPASERPPAGPPPTLDDGGWAETTGRALMRAYLDARCDGKGGVASDVRAAADTLRLSRWLPLPAPDEDGHQAAGGREPLAGETEVWHAEGALSR